MESIIIVIIGLIFSVLSKSVKDKKEIDKQKQKRKEQLRGREHQAFESKDTERRVATNNNKSLRDIFMEELKKVEGDEGDFGDILKKPFKIEDEKELRTESVHTSYESEDRYVSEQEYLEKKGYRDTRDSVAERYKSEATIEANNEVIQDEIVSSSRRKRSRSIDSPRVKRTIKDNRQYNPFNKSLNRKDLIRGIIFSEVLNKPKSLRGEKRSM